MVSILNLEILGMSVGLMTSSSFPGENQVDPSMSVHSYRSRCAATSLLASDLRAYFFCTARIMSASLDPKLPRKPVTGRESLQMPTVRRRL